MSRLLSINNYHYRRGGADIVYLEHAALFKGLGWDTAYFAMQHPNNLPCIWSEYFVDEIELGNDYSLAAKFSKSIKVIYSFEAQRKLRRLLERFRPTVAHLHNIYHHLSPSILSTLRASGTPVVLTAHDLKIACPNYRMLSGKQICERCKGGRFHNVVLQRCVHESRAASTIVAMEAALHSLLGSYRKHVDRIVVPSRFFMDKFMDWGWEPERFIHIPNFVETEKLEPAFQPGRYFLYFGRLSFEKGVPTLIKAAAVAGVPLKIAGTGPDAGALQELSDSLGGDVEFLGYRSGEDLHDLVRASRAVVLPSEWYENAPLSVLESFAMGKPVIGARIGGIPELVQPEATGWLFQSGDDRELADLLSRVQGLPDEWVAALGRSARDIALTRFSKSSYLEATRTLYDVLVTN